MGPEPGHQEQDLIERVERERACWRHGPRRFLGDDRAKGFVLDRRRGIGKRGAYHALTRASSLSMVSSMYGWQLFGVVYLGVTTH